MASVACLPVAVVAGVADAGEEGVGVGGVWVAELAGSSNDEVTAVTDAALAVIVLVGAAVGYA